MVRKGGQATAKQLAALTHRFPLGHGGFDSPGNKGMRGLWKRPDNKTNLRGFCREGQPGRYRGGAVVAHLSTHQDGLGASLANRMRLAGHKSRSKEREIMEALQNGKAPIELKKRYPPLQVERLAQLHDVAVDITHRDFIKAQILVREILVRNEADGDGTRPSEATTITLLHGTADRIPLPGAASAAPEAGADTTPAGAERG